MLSPCRFHDFWVGDVRMKLRVRTVFVLAAALVLSTAVFRQAREIHRLREAIAKAPQQETAIPPVVTTLSEDVEKLRREAAEVHSLRAEVSNLRREKAERTALEARMDRLPQELSAILGDANQPDNSASITQSLMEESERLLAELTLGRDRDRVTLALIERWTAIDPGASSTWSAELPDGPLRNAAMTTVARQWALRDWNATANWLQRLAPGSSRDAAIDAFVTSADGYDIKLALEWANQMADPESRAARVEQVASRWLREDSAAARTWLKNAQLPPGVAERLSPIE